MAQVNRIETMLAVREMKKVYNALLDSEEPEEILEAQHRRNQIHCLAESIHMVAKTINVKVQLKKIRTYEYYEGVQSMDTTRKCKICEVEIPEGVFCSKSCRVEGNRVRSRERKRVIRSIDRKDKFCPICSTKIADDARRHTYCSPKCKKTAADAIELARRKYGYSRAHAQKPYAEQRSGEYRKPEVAQQPALKPEPPPTYTKEERKRMQGEQLRLTRVGIANYHKNYGL